MLLKAWRSMNNTRHDYKFCLQLKAATNACSLRFLLFSILALFLLLPVSSAKGERLRIEAAYCQPSHIGRILVRNTGGDSCSLSEAQLVTSEGAPLPVTWLICEPERLSSGEVGLISWLGSSDLLAGGSERWGLSWKGEFHGINLSEEHVSVRYSLRDEGGQFYLYIHNGCSRQLLVKECFIQGMPLDFSAPVSLDPGGQGLLSGRVERLKKAASEAAPFVIVELVDGEGGRYVTFSRLFNPSQLGLLSNVSGQAVRKCFHGEGTSSEKADTVIRGGRLKGEKLRILGFCNWDTDAGEARVYAQLADQNHIEPQLAYPKLCASGSFVSTFLSVCEKTKVWTEPGTFFTLFFPADIHLKNMASYSFNNLRKMAYAMIAGGAKGIEFQSIKWEDPDGSVTRNFNRLQEELKSLESLWIISEPVDLIERCPQGKVLRTLLCGDRGILLFIFPDEHWSGAVTDSLVELRIPSGFVPQSQAMIAGGRYGTKELTRQPGLVGLTCSEDDFEVLFIPFESVSPVEGS
jgi:hypothetical protein